MATSRFAASIAALTLFGFASAGHASISSLPGSPANEDPFRFVFDENGNAYFQTWLGSDYGPKTVVKPVPGAPVLAWALPQPVVPGDVSFAEPPSTKCTSPADCSDGLRFLNLNGNSFLIFLSGKPEAGEPAALADTGFPDGFDFTTWAFAEVGPENGVNGFTYRAGFDGNGSSNVYVGISDTPEPATWAMMLIGFAGLGYAGYRRTKSFRVDQPAV